MLAYNVGIVITFITFLLLWFVHCSDFTWIFFLADWTHFGVLDWEECFGGRRIW